MAASTSITDAVLAADKRFFDALLAADKKALEEILASEFLIVDVASGGLTQRAEFIEFVISGAVRFINIESFPSQSIVRHFADTAIVIGRTAIEFVLPDGQQVNAASRYTHVFLASGQAWRLVSAQGTPIN
jgi:ketosteroid isomerase-like protein